MVGLTTFGWSVGLSAWATIAAAVLTHRNQPELLTLSFYVSVPLIAVGFVYTAASLFVIFLRCFIYVVSVMVQGEVLLGVVVCVLTTAGIQWGVVVRRAIKSNPASVSPTVLAIFLRCEEIVEQVQTTIERGYTMGLYVGAQIAEGRSSPRVIATDAATVAEPDAATVAATVAEPDTEPDAEPIVEPDAATVVSTTEVTLRAMAPPLLPLLPLLPPSQETSDDDEMRRPLPDDLSTLLKED
jgi:hypothetical protein